MRRRKVLPGSNAVSERPSGICPDRRLDAINIDLKKPSHVNPPTDSSPEPYLDHEWPKIILGRELPSAGGDLSVQKAPEISFGCEVNIEIYESEVDTKHIWPTMRWFFHPSPSEWRIFPGILRRRRPGPSESHMSVI
jgi:hypothetical protein